MKDRIASIKTMLEVKNETKESADLYLYGTIREACWWDDAEDDDIVSAKGVKKALKGLKGKNINIHINSGGGDVFESIAIGNQLKQHDGEITVIIDGLAGSGASIVAMSGKTIQMFDNAMMMIHKAWTWAIGNADELRKIADDMDKVDTSVKASYRGRFVGTDEELDDLIAEETWLTAKECETFGFCDEILDEKEEDTEGQASVKVSLFEKYKTTDDKKQNLFKKFEGGKE